MDLDRKFFITGGSGRLGSFVIKALEKINNVKYLAPASNLCDITKIKDVKHYLNEFKPDVVLHFAAYTDVKKAESEDYIKCMDINVMGTLNLIKACHENNISLVYMSTDAVFDGKKGLYKPSDPVNPQNKYSRSKCAAELCVRNYKNSCIIRTAFFENDFPYPAAFTDQITTKDYLDNTGPLILNTCLNFKSSKIYHIGTENKTMYSLAIARRNNIKPIKLSDFSLLNIARDLSFDIDVRMESY